MSRNIIGKIICLFLISVLLVGCGAKGGTDKMAGEGTAPGEADEKQASGEKIEIRLATPWTQGAVASESIGALITAFEQEHPNVKIVHDAQSTNDLRTKLTVEAAAGNLPDVSWCPANYAREFVKDGLIINWADVVNDPKHPEFKEWFSEATIASLTEADGTILLAPQEGSIDGLYYNKEMFANNGWGAPKTWDELMALIPKIKEQNLIPIVAGGKDSRFAWLASALTVRAAGLDNFKSLCLGENLTKWNDESLGFPEAVTKFKELVDAGAYPSGVLGMSVAEADQMFATQQAAMYYEGAWKPGNFITEGGDGFIEKVERIDFPAMTDCADGDSNVRVGGCILGFMVREGLDETKKELCIELTKKICSPEFNVPIMEKGSFVYAGNSEYDSSACSGVMVQLIEAYRTAEAYVPSMDCIAPPAIDLAIKQTAFPGIITKEYDVKQAVAEVQKAAEDYAASLSE